MYVQRMHVYAWFCPHVFAVFVKSKMSTLFFFFDRVNKAE